MLVRLLLIFSIVPLVELALLIRVGSYMGIIPTILLVGGTGVVGITLARAQGFQLIKDVQGSLQKGQIPADHLIQGLLILIGAVMLLTPGLLTDTAGFLLIIPFTRKIIAHFAKDKIRRWIAKGTFNVSYGEYKTPPGGGEGATFSGKWHTGNNGNNGESMDVDFEDIKE